MKLPLLIQIAGLLQIALLSAGLSMPKAVGLRKHLATLPDFIRRLVWVYFVFIGLVLVGFGTLSLIYAHELASGTPLARGFCGFVTVFWTLRLLVAAFVFDVRPYLTNTFYRVGYAATNVVFLYLPLVYFWAAWKGGTL